MDWREARALFPSVDKTVYLNTAGGGPLSERSAAAGRAYYDQSLEDGDIHWDAWLEQVERVRGKLARFLNAAPANVAFTPNASTGLNVAAHMLRGDGRVLAVADEFPSCTLPFLQLGYDVDFVATAPDGTLEIDALEAAASEQTAVLAVSFVQYKFGFRNDLERLGVFCRERELAFVVDATQGLGAFPIDVAANHADFLSFSAYKWATSGYSIGAVYLSDRFLTPERYPMVGWRSARDPYALVYDSLDLTPGAQALEQGHPPFPGIFALGASLDLVAEIGIDRIAARIVELARYLHERLDAAGIGVLSTRDEGHLSGITVAAAQDPSEVVARLRAEGIIVSTRGAGIRVSVHYYNNRADIERFVAALAAS